MDWTWIAFMVVAAGVWLIVTVFRKAEEERQRNLPRPGGATGRRPATDLDRFLDEARRRREAGQPPAPARPAEAPWALPVNQPAQRKAREVRPLRPAPKPERPPVFVPSVRRSASESRRELPEALPVPPPRPAAPVVLERVPDDEPTVPCVPAAAAQPAAPPVVAVPGRTPPPLSPASKQLSGLLRRPETIGTAFVLGVVFGPPVCRRFQ